MRMNRLTQASSVPARSAVAAALALAGLTLALFGATVAFLAFPLRAAAQGADAAPSTAPSLSEEVREFVTYDAPVIALTNVILIDGTGASPEHGQTIVVQEGRISAVGPAADVQVPAGAEVLDLSGHTVIPGLVGMHDHLFYSGTGGRQVHLGFSAPRLYLGAGVTTIRTTGTASPYADINLKAAIEAGEVPGPRIHITAPYITGVGNGSPNAMARVTSPAEAERFVEYWAEEGATWIKAYTDIRRADLAAAVEAAHRLGLRVTGHLCSVTYREAVDLGIDNLEHGLLTATDFVDAKEADACPPNPLLAVGRAADPDGRIAGELIDHMVAQGVGMTFTGAVIEPLIPGRPTRDPRTLEAMAPAVRDAYLQARARIDSAGDAFPFTEEMLRNGMAFAHRFAQAGGLLAAGVDPTGIGGTLPGFGDQRNYELLVEAGFAPAQAVRVMTANGATILDVEDRLGTVEEGKLADLVVLEGDLSADPSVIRNVVTAFKGGIGYDSPALIASVEGEVGIR